MQSAQKRNYLAELEGKTQEMAIMLNNSDHSLTQLHICLSVVNEAIETETSLEELKSALYAAIRTRRE